MKQTKIYVLYVPSINLNNNQVFNKNFNHFPGVLHVIYCCFYPLEAYSNLVSLTPFSQNSINPNEGLLKEIGFIVKDQFDVKASKRGG